MPHRPPAGQPHAPVCPPSPSRASASSAALPCCALTVTPAGSLRRCDRSEASRAQSGVGASALAAVSASRRARWSKATRGVTGNVALHVERGAHYSLHGARGAWLPSFHAALPASRLSHTGPVRPVPRPYPPVSPDRPPPRLLPWVRGGLVTVPCAFPASLDCGGDCAGLRCVIAERA